MNLPEFIKQKMHEHNLSTYDVARNSGGIIQQPYVMRVLNGKIVNPSTPKLRGLAKGVFTPEEVIFNIVKYPDSSANVLTDANLTEIQQLLPELSDSQKEYVNNLLKMVVREVRQLKNFSAK